MGVIIFLYFFIPSYMISAKSLDFLYAYLDDISERAPKLLVKNEPTDTEIILGNLSCLIEEVGETAAEVRKMTKLSFSHKKCEAFEIQALEEEIADVLITTFLLAKSVGIKSLDETIQRKIQKNKDRGY